MITAAVSVPLPQLAILDMLGGSELLVIFLLVLIFFGGEKMPEFAKGLGKAIREFRKAASGVEQEFKKAMEEEPAPKPVYTPTPTILPPTAATHAASTAVTPPDPYSAAQHSGSSTALPSVPPAPAVAAPPAPNVPANGAVTPPSEPHVDAG